MNDYLMDISYMISILIEIGLPITLAIFIWKKFKTSWAIFFLGTGLFLASLIRIPLNNFVTGIIKHNFDEEMLVVLSGLFASFTAGLFEEGVRAIGIGAMIKNKNYYKGIMYGIGHGGGGESMIFVGFSVLANYIVFRFLPHIIPKENLSILEDMAWYMPMVGAMERVFAIAIQISLSALIMYAFLSKRYYFIIIAFFYHMLIDFVAVYLGYKSGILITEIAVFVFALISIAIIFLLKPKKVKSSHR